MGATLTAMLLGHYYLIAPAMTIAPLQRSVALIAVGLAAIRFGNTVGAKPRFGSG